MEQQSKPLFWLHGEVKTPPFTQAARIEAGVLLRQLQEGEIYWVAIFAPYAKYRHFLLRATDSRC